MSRQNASERQAAQRQARGNREPVFRRGAGGGQGNRNRRQVSAPAAPSAPSAPAASAFTSGDGGTTYTTLPDGRQVYRPANSDAVYDRKTGQSVFLNDATDDPNDTQTYPHGFGLTQKDGRDYAVPNSAPAPSRTSGPAGSSTITNANGVTQSGRNLSAINMPGLAEFERYAGGTIANFAGPSFPTQADTNKITDNFANTGGYKATTQGETGGVSLEGRGELKPTATGFSSPPNLRIADRDLITQTNKPGGPFAGAPMPTEGQPDPNLRKGIDAGIAADGGTPQEKSPFAAADPASYATSNEEMRRRAAFLDPNVDSLGGLRAVERGMGMVYAGGNHYANVNGEMKGIDSADARAIKNAAPGEAQALKDKWVSALSEAKTEEPETPSVSQDPTFEGDKTKATAGISESVPNVPNTRDFSVNNNENTGIGFDNAPNITGNSPKGRDLAKKFYLK